MKVETHSGEAVYSHIEEVLGLDILEAYRVVEKRLQADFGQVQIITEPYRDLEQGIKGLSLFSMTGKGVIFLKIEMDKEGNIKVI